MASSFENSSLVRPYQTDMDQSQLAANETRSLQPMVPGNTPTYSQFYHPTPSPADSGVMSPLTPLSNYTNSMSGPNCTPEQNVISSPEHSVASFPGCSISTHCGSAASSV